jgi:hypothetical protein
MHKLTKDILHQLIEEGYNFAALQDFKMIDGVNTLCIRPLQGISSSDHLLYSITSLTDPMITAPLESESSSVVVKYVK